MNKNFAPGMVMLNGIISPGSSGGYVIGKEDGLVSMYVDPMTGYTFVYDEDTGWVCEDDPSLIYSEIQEDWIALS